MQEQELNLTTGATASATPSEGNRAEVRATGPTATETPSAPQQAADAPKVRKQYAPRHLKIVVYAICKNESQFVKRWMDSMKEADAVVVLDTGSTDDTVAKLKAEGAEVETQIFNPWRFDTSRNASIDLALKLHPDADLLVCTDIDEYFIAGWREKLEKGWKTAMRECKAKNRESPTTVQYEYVWNFREDGSDGTKFWYEKIHTPVSGARWTHPVHEILSYPVRKVIVRVADIRLEHHADFTKSRRQYLPLLEMSVREAPTDDRNMHYLGREYMFHHRWDDSIAALKRHLALPTAKWKAERAASMRYIARCYGEKGDMARKEAWLWRAVCEASDEREACLELAELMHDNRDWPGLVQVCEIMLSRTERHMSYLTRPEAWGARPYDLYCVGLWWTGRRIAALAALDAALGITPNDERLQNNRRVMVEAMARDGALTNAAGNE